MIEKILPLVIVFVFAAIHLFGWRIRSLQAQPRSRWLSLGGGVSVAYVFVHLLPELASHQGRFEEIVDGQAGLIAEIESHTYLIALLGLVVFYGLDRLALRTKPEADTASGSPSLQDDGAFWLHLWSFALYNSLIAYLLLHREEDDLRGLIIYGFAMSLHFLVNDQGLRHSHGALYDHRGRWLLAVSPFLGFGLGIFVTIPELAISALFAFLAGSIVMNVIKEELPKERDSRFLAFVSGALGYAALLLATG
ncbi:hypothetical protein [Peteryoungia desertarenae]|uniref:hypothetical protein n=1 Tax=Peteryoungia desertarenae TaxID=1813451 RepID=UPI001FE5D72F|nr:hypothetical protein [Peteryoungia desertarenae]